MQSHKYKLPCFFYITIVAVLAMGAGMNEDSSDGRSGHNGSPGEQTCAKSNCHNTFTLNSGEGEVVISSADLTNWSYQPGQTYQISLTVSQSGAPLFGFGFEALDASGNNAGILTAGTDSHALFAMVSGVNRKTITHLENSGLVSQSKTWNFTWTAPMDPITVTFYAVGNAANNNGGRTGDHIYSTSQVVIPIVPNINPPVISTSGPLTFCEGNSVQLSVVPQAGVQYHWFNNGINIAQGETFVATTDGCYSVEGMTANDTVLSENQICVEVTTISNDIIIQSGVLTAAQNADSYQWIRCDDNTEIPNAIQQSYAPTDNGNYAVEITLNGCVETSDCVSLLANNYNEVGSSKQSEVRYNPLGNELLIYNEGSCAIEIMDASGKIAYRGLSSPSARLNTSGWLKGIYLVKVTNNLGSTVTKILIY